MLRNVSVSHFAIDEQHREQRENDERCSVCWFVNSLHEICVKQNTHQTKRKTQTKKHNTRALLSTASWRMQRRWRNSARDSEDGGEGETTTASNTQHKTNKQKQILLDAQGFDVCITRDAKKREHTKHKKQNMRSQIQCITQNFAQPPAAGPPLTSYKPRKRINHHSKPFNAIVCHRRRSPSPSIH